MTLQVIGAGLGRTGTASLKVALEQLGFGPCYHMGEVIGRPSDIDLWLAVVEGKADWPALLGNYRATSDYPACLYYKELAELHPDAKVVLTVRDAHRWFDSINETIMSPAFTSTIKDTPFGILNKRAIWDRYDGRVHDRDHMVAAFQQHVADVKRAIPADRLLIYEVAQGWEPLCAFLDVPVPATEFPRANTRDETRKIIDIIMAGDPEQAGQAADALFGKRT